MSEAYSSNAPAASQQAQLNNEQNAEAGPSSPIPPQPPKTDPIRDGYLDDWAKYSPLPSSAIPRDKIRGTDEPITDFFCSRALGEINDAELLRDVPLLGPPPQPGKGSIRYEPVPYWGMSSERCEFFVEKWRNEHDRVPVNSAVQANVERYHKLKAEGVHFNQVLMQNRSFKNPHVYAQLVNHLGIDETSSNLPSLDTSRYTGFWRSMFPFSEDELIEGDPIAISKQQEDEHLKKKLEQLHSNKRRNINFTRGSADQAATSGRARGEVESAWDEPARPRKAANTGHHGPSHASQSNGGSNSTQRPSSSGSRANTSKTNLRNQSSRRRG